MSPGCTVSDGGNVTQDGTDKDLKKTKAMVFTSGFVWRKWWGGAYKRQEKVEEENFREKKRLQVSCTKCGVTVAQL